MGEPNAGISVNKLQLKHTRANLNEECYPTYLTRGSTSLAKASYISGTCSGGHFAEITMWFSPISM